MGETVQDIVQGKASFVSGEIQWAGMKCVLHTHSMGDRLTYTKEDFSPLSRQFKARFWHTSIGT